MSFVYFYICLYVCVCVCVFTRHTEFYENNDQTQLDMSRSFRTMEYSDTSPTRTAKKKDANSPFLSLNSRHSSIEFTNPSFFRKLLGVEPYDSSSSCLYHRRHRSKSIASTHSRPSKSNHTITSNNNNININININNIVNDSLDRRKYNRNDETCVLVKFRNADREKKKKQRKKTKASKKKRGMNG
ncbi:hypothetical protein RFI_23374 [Reticulomyxa filosa]|uniref:Uncharacterized protein n=1 Tax=Reticulomyxa filosa TaxID=46433 RepID=X6MJ11_RETFI|nr:hypothetical protein RFI_23374 [Reticulomyxa filosa]|eukprot:ETO13993.1 hypothetical protein RFI_23374 [Reticulomyxa filosa]